MQCCLQVSARPHSHQRRPYWMAPMSKGVSTLRKSDAPQIPTAQPLSHKPSTRIQVQDILIPSFVQKCLSSQFAVLELRSPASWPRTTAHDASRCKAGNMLLKHFIRLEACIHVVFNYPMAVQTGKNFLQTQPATSNRLLVETSSACRDG